MNCWGMGWCSLVSGFWKLVSLGANSSLFIGGIRGSAGWLTLLRTLPQPCQVRRRAWSFQLSWTRINASFSVHWVYYPWLPYLFVPLKQWLYSVVLGNIFATFPRWHFGAYRVSHLFWCGLLNCTLERFWLAPSISRVKSAAFPTVFTLFHPGAVSCWIFGSLIFAAMLQSAKNWKFWGTEKFPQPSSGDRDDSIYVCRLLNVIPQPRKEIQSTL